MGRMNHAPHTPGLLAALLAVVLPHLGGCAATLRTCPTRDVARMQHVDTSHRQASFWIKKHGDTSADILLSPQEIEQLNRSNATRPWAFQDVTHDAISADERVERECTERTAWLQKRVLSGAYISSSQTMLAIAEVRIASGEKVDELRVLSERADLRCIPSAGTFRSAEGSPHFDRNQCSGLNAGELVRVLRRTGDWSYVHAGHSVGWVEGAPWSAPITAPRAREFRDALPRAVVVRSATPFPFSGGAILGASYPIVESAPDGSSWKVMLPTHQGLEPTRVGPTKDMAYGWLPLTRDSVFSTIFSELDRPYAWGEKGGGTDCSRLLLDVFRAHGVSLGRNSAEQSRSGSRAIDVGRHTVDEKRKFIRRQAERGIVLLFMPGHIMLYLGEDQGHDYGISAIESFATTCPGGEGQHTLGRVGVSDLSVGHGTTRGSFIQRITRIAFFGPTESP